jgi:hypothetical protein
MPERRWRKPRAMPGTTYYRNPGSEARARMAVVYVEARPKGRIEGTTVTDYVVEDHADRVLATFRTQGDAIYWAKRQCHTVQVARVRHLNDKTNPDHWRAV